MKKGALKLAIFAVLLVWLIVGFAIIWGKGGISDIIDAQKKESELKREISEIENEIEKLKSEIEKLKTSPQIYEIPAREKLFMKKKGEYVIYISEKPQNKFVEDK